MRPGKNRYENWSEEQLEERFGNIEEKMEAMSLESLIQGFQERVEEENKPGDATSFRVSEEQVKELKAELKEEEEKKEEEKKVMEEKKKEKKEEKKEETNDEEWEEKEFYMTREDYERLKNPDGTITINGENLVIEGIQDVKEGEVQDEEVPFIEVRDEK